MTGNAIIIKISRRQSKRNRRSHFPTWKLSKIEPCHWIRSISPSEETLQGLCGTFIYTDYIFTAILLFLTILLLWRVSHPNYFAICSPIKLLLLLWKMNGLCRLFFLRTMSWNLIHNFLVAFTIHGIINQILRSFYPSINVHFFFFLYYLDRQEKTLIYYSYKFAMKLTGWISVSLFKELVDLLLSNLLHLNFFLFSYRLYHTSFKNPYIWRSW